MPWDSNNKKLIFAKTTLSQLMACTVIQQDGMNSCWNRGVKTPLLQATDIKTCKSSTTLLWTFSLVFSGGLVYVIEEVYFNKISPTYVQTIFIK